MPTKPAPGAESDNSAVSIQGSKGIRVLRGALVWHGPQGNSFDARGTADLRMSAFPGDGVFEPAEECNFGGGCVPGMSINLHATWSSGDLPGSVRIRGKDYRLSNFDLTAYDASIEFFGRVVAPPLSSSTTASAPFTFSGRLIPNFGGDAVLLSGAGTAMLTLVQQPQPLAWFVSSATYTFE